MSSTGLLVHSERSSARIILCGCPSLVYPKTCQLVSEAPEMQNFGGAGITILGTFQLLVQQKGVALADIPTVDMPRFFVDYLYMMSTRSWIG